jgi:hypothetical protein
MAVDRAVLMASSVLALGVRSQGLTQDQACSMGFW